MNTYEEMQILLTFALLVVAILNLRVKTTGLAGGLFCPYKGLLPACARKAH